MPGKAKYLVGVLTLSAAGILGIQSREGTPNKVYRDVIGINTVCTGHVTKLPVGTVISQTVCEKYLQDDTTEAQREIKADVKVPVTQEQYDAMTSLVFNIGISAFRKSTLLRDINSKQCIAAGEEWLKWNKAGGQPVRGLTIRRQEESKLWLSGC